LKPWIENFATSVRTVTIGWFTQQHNTKLCLISRSSTTSLR